MTDLNALVSALRGAAKILLVMHVSPDGDTCGSALALRRSLVYLGKNVTVACDQPVPRICGGLDGASEVKHAAEIENESFDLAVAVDVASPDRMGKLWEIFSRVPQTAQVDHHGTNPRYCGVNLISSPLSATGVLILQVMDALNVPLDEKTACCLYAAVSTDTGNFKQANTDEAALLLAARCVKTGMDCAALCRRLFDLRPLAQTQLIGKAISSLKMLCGGRIALMVLRHEDFVECGAADEHTEGIVNFATNIEGAQMACLLSMPRDKVRCSMRAQEPFSVARVAGRFAGGGHALAAGCTLGEDMDKAIEQISAALTEEMENAQ